MREPPSLQSFQAKARDAANLLQRGGELDFAGVSQSRLDMLDDAGPAEAFHGDDEGKTELLTVRLVQRLHARLLRGGASVEARAGLLAARSLGELRGLELAQKLRMRANERELLVVRGAVHGALHRRVQRIAGSERPPGEDALRNPR